jgi:hypothetical protein
VSVRGQAPRGGLGFRQLEVREVIKQDGSHIATKSGHRYLPSHVALPAAVFALVAANIALPYAGPGLSEAVLGLIMAGLAFTRLRTPAPADTRWIRMIIIAYTAFVFLDHVLVHDRPYAFLQFMVGPGALLLLASVAIRFNRLDALVVTLTMICVGVTLLFARGDASMLVPQGGTVGLTLGNPDEFQGAKHLTGLIGFLLFVIPWWLQERAHPRRWFHYFGAILGLYLVAFSGSRAYIEAVLLFVFALVVWTIGAHWRPWLRNATLVAFSLAVIIGSLALLLVPAVSETAAELLPESIGVQAERPDITAGRNMLTLQHFLLYQTDPVWGIGWFEITDEYSLADLTAATESYLTYAVARDGIGGFFNCLLLVAICWYAVTSGSRFKYAFSFLVIVSMVDLGYFIGLYAFSPFLVAALLFDHPPQADAVSSSLRLAESISRASE